MENNRACGDRECCCGDSKLKLVEQMAMHRADIRCLDGRVGRAERDLRERYTKEEVDQKLTGKADRCALEAHSVDACAHRGGCRSPRDCGKPWSCGCDCYTKDEIDALLEKKVDQTPLARLEWFSLPAINGATGTIEYTKHPIGLATLTISSLVRNTVSGIEIGVLPAGFRPMRGEARFRVPASRNPGSTSLSVTLVVYTDGTIRLTYGADCPEDAEFSGTVHFWAEQ